MKKFIKKLRNRARFADKAGNQHPKFIEGLRCAANMLEREDKSHWNACAQALDAIGDRGTEPPAAPAVPASDPPVMELIGKYWDLGFTEGKTGVNQADAANEVLRQIRRALAQQPAAAVPSLASVLDEYERQTKALPGQHEIPERGCSTYNWRMAVIRDLRAMLAAAQREGE